MSQDTFPMVDGEESAPFADEGENNRKAVFVAGGIAAAVVLAAGGWFLLGSGGGGDNTASAAPVVHRPGVVASAPKATAKTGKKLPAVYKAQLGRDPFKALYVLPVSAPAGSTTPTGPSVPAGSGTTSTSAGTPSAGGGTANTPTAGTTRYSLKLVSINSPKAGDAHIFTWLVDGKRFETIASQRFGKVGEIVVLTYEKNSANKAVGAIIQVGDDSPIDVLIGESISVL